MGLLRYYWIVVHCAWREAWGIVVPHSLRQLLRDGVVFLVALGLLYLFQGWLVDRDFTSAADNLKDILVWIVLILVAIVALFSFLFVVEALFIVPYRLWNELNSQIAFAENKETRSDSVAKLQSGQWELAYPARHDDHPNWSIRELFYHVDPDVLDHWEDVAAQIRDQLSLARLKSWGRKGVQTLLERECGEGPAPLTEILPHYWEEANFTYTFFDEGKAPTEEPHTYVGTFSELPVYSDLQVNRTQALRIWPKRSADDENTN